MKKLVKKVVNEGKKIPFTFINISKKSIRKAIVHLKHLLNAHPKLKSHLLLLLGPFPGLKTKLKNVSPINTNIYMTINHIDGPDKLPLRAKKRYDQLKMAVDDIKRKP